MKKLISVCLVLLVLLCISGCDKNVTWNGKTEQMLRLSMVEDISDMKKYVGLVDYVFVGTVEEVVDEVLPNNIKEHDDYYSTYKIRVNKNLKGELVEEIEASKMGGLKSDGTMCLVTAETPNGEMINDSGLPEVNRQYIFLAYAQEDGDLTLSEILDDRECTDVLIEEYSEYIKNEITFNRERFSSRYEISHD